MSSIPRNVLPADPKPHHYAVSITPDFDTFTFTGHVDIKLTASNPQKSITLNCNELTFSKVSIAPANNPSGMKNVPVDGISFDADAMRATIPLQETFTGDAILSIDYAGIINDKLAGFYRSKYTVNGKEAYMGTTQFEAVDARRALPCWDEPALKAVFALDITAPSHMMVLANTLHNKKEDLGGKTRWIFDPTPIMSTYLLAWTVGVFEYVERRIPKALKVQENEEQHTLVRVYTPEGKKSQTSFALDVACRVLPLYEKFFESNYILPKVDLLAVPDFAAGAMENWGLITYREVALLCDENSSASHRERVALVIAHELAHQWFGNLVTMEWWKELWLNESFATYMQYWSVNKLFPEWRVFTQFVNSEISRALSLDALRTSHPVEVDVQNAQEIDSIFDAISYSKGGSIIRMVINFIGEEPFQKGMAAYLKHFAFGNATTKDLWDFLGKAAGRPLAPVLQHWTGKQGYPYLTVTSGSDNKTLHLLQQRYLSTGDATTSENETVWKIPLLVTMPETGAPITTVFEEREGSLPLPHASWVKVNSDQSAFCRVLYGSEKLLQDLLPAISAKQVTNIDRLGIIADYHAFASAGYCKTVDAIKLLSSYINEDDYTVWCAIISFEKDLRLLVSSQGEKAVEALNVFARKLYAKVIEKVGFIPKPEDDHISAQLRAAIFNRLAAADDQEAVAHALSFYESRQNTPIPADFRSTVFSVYLRKNGREALDELKMMASNASDAMERSLYLMSLASSKVEGLASELFAFALSDAVRSQDAVYVFSGLARNPLTFNAFAQELMNSWRLLGQRLPGLMLGSLLSLVAFGADLSVATKLEEFWNKIDEREKMGMTRNFQQGIEGIRNNASWVSREAKTVSDFISNATF